MTTPEELEEAKAAGEAVAKWLESQAVNFAPGADAQWCINHDAPKLLDMAATVRTLLSAVSGDGWRPEGWVLVPKVPTTEQRRKNAARVAIMLRAVTGKDFAGWDFADDLYDQFVRAAPLPPVPEGT